MNSESDEQLVRDYLAGDDNALRKLFERYVNPLHRFVFRYVGITEDAEDLIQDVLFSVWKHIKKFDLSKRFKTWIFAIAKNAAFNWLKKKKPIAFSTWEKKYNNNNSFFEDTVEDPAPLPEELFFDPRLTDALARALLQLNANDRAVLLLYYNNHFNFMEIAAILKESVNTIKSRHRRALIKLRSLLVP